MRQQSLSKMYLYRSLVKKGPVSNIHQPPNFALIFCKGLKCTLKSAHLVTLRGEDFHWRILEKSKATNSERLLSTDQRTFLDTKEAWLHFVLWTPVKSSDQEPRNGAIKRSRTIFSDQDSWSRSQTLLQATRMWLPLATWSAIPFEGQGNVNIHVGGRFLRLM